MYAFGAVRDNSSRAQGEVVLPTPTSTDYKRTGSSTSDNRRKSPALPVVETVLPTPNASDGNGGRFNSAGHQSSLPGTAREIRQWGKYAPAIQRWEQATGPAPAPTEPNRNGKPRLSAAFAEWMMGLPAGHVTNPAIGISRAEQLKAIGNGVCPHQAAAAIQLLIGAP